MLFKKYIIADKKHQILMIEKKFSPLFPHINNPNPYKYCERV